VTSSAFDRLRALPRVALIDAPTPIARLERFERAIDSPYPIFIKRDDAIPFGFGGNKVRKLELVMARALAEEASAVITCGGVQSNHCRATAAAAARAGLECHLVLSGGQPHSTTGNTRLDEIFGARLHFVGGREERTPAMERISSELRARGQRPVVIPLGASTALGAAGFALGVSELVAQGWRPHVVVHASSSGGTQAGLVAGAALAGLSTRIIGVSADESASALQAIVDSLARGVLELAGSGAHAQPAEVRDAFVGNGYGIPTDESREALTLLARSEGVVVDHTYTAKALACLVSLIRQRSFSEGSTILFWHTGGQVGVLA
jgi:D-cysteine desulfhydrase